MRKKTFEETIAYYNAKKISSRDDRDIYVGTCLTGYVILEKAASGYSLHLVTKDHFNAIQAYNNTHSTDQI
jgi:hypothetical protein